MLTVTGTELYRLIQVALKYSEVRELDNKLKAISESNISPRKVNGPPLTERRLNVPDMDSIEPQYDRMKVAVN